MYLHNCWYVAAFDDELQPGKMLARTVIELPMVIYRTSSGALTALEDRCVHRLAPLSKGRLEGDNLRCMYHGLLYAADGRCIAIPGQEAIPSRASVRRYPVAQKHGWIWVWPGESAKADIASIPYCYGFDNPEWIMRRQFIEYSANYSLLNDNLTDLSHLTYVHAKSFNADDQWAEKRPKVTTLDRGVRFERWLENTPPIPPLGGAAGHDKVDHWATYDYVVPGLFLFYNALYPVGTAQRCAFESPQDTPLFEHYTQQAVTPVGPRNTRYLFGWGPSSRLGSQSDAEIMSQVLDAAFNEDKDMIEAQQRVIDADPSAKPLPLSTDKGVVLFQRLMQKLQTEEAVAGKTSVA
jgi:phenylpropionate dioxygenase-like ring-hydroxylating dioxygenase large terminal subunit